MKKLNKKQTTAMAMAMVGLFGMGSVLGASTTAKYSKGMYKSTGALNSAIFDVSSNMEGNVDKVTLSGEQLFPGSGGQLLKFDINKGGTQVPVEYKLTLKTEGELFATGTPVKLIAHRAVDGVVKDKVELTFNEGVYTSNALKPLSNNDTFIVDWDWGFESGASDNSFSGKQGVVTVRLDAEQAKQ